jgi:hypothetical protein
MLHYSKKLIWLLAAIALASALWALNVEITYERNVRHIPTNFYQHHRSAPHRWKA